MTFKRTMSDATPERAMPGFGLGLRTQHFADFLSSRQPVDWLEAITDNFLVDGGRPLVMLDTFRRDYPIALHGVAMSLGSERGIDVDYVRKVRRLADRIDALWVSDHLCWTGPAGRPLHDLYPVPYTEDAARRIIGHIRHAQDLLQRRLVVENVSSYLRYRDSSATEWEFLAHVATEADCDLLVDVNNVYVSSVNHGFDPAAYLRAMPPARVRQIHLAGHSISGDSIIDTHDHPVCPHVWDLYAQACALFGPVATMIERDDRIPPLPELLDELQHARRIADGSHRSTDTSAPAPDRQRGRASIGGFDAAGPSMGLGSIQDQVGELILARSSIPAEAALPALLDSGGPLPGRRGIEIYRNAYRARLAEVLADHFPKLVRYVGPAHFDILARAYVATHPPRGRHLGRYGDRFAEHLAAVHPDDPVLTELAELEWRLRTAFDAVDQAAWNTERVQHEGPAQCLHQWPVLHATVSFLTQRTNALPIWQAIDRDDEVPEVRSRSTPLAVVVWRKGLQPCFMSLDEDEAAFLTALVPAGQTIAEVAGQPGRHRDAAQFGIWLHRWWDQELLAAPA